MLNFEVTENEIERTHLCKTRHGTMTVTEYKDDGLCNIDWDYPETPSNHRKHGKRLAELKWGIDISLQKATDWYHNKYTCPMPKGMKR